MKKAHVLPLLVSALGLVAGASAADTVSLEFGPNYGGQNPWQAGGGGEFTAYASTGIPSTYSPDAILTLDGGTGFETFCIQPNVDAANQTTYNFAVTPDLWVPTSGLNVAGATWVPLSKGTAWLYAQFASGVLPYDYADSDKNNSRLNNASDLQQTLWYLQGETYAPANLTYVNLAVNQFGSLNAAMSAESPYEFGTSVLDLYSTGPSGSATVAQDVLVYGLPPSSAPDTASTALLLGGGALALFAARRRPRLARF